MSDGEDLARQAEELAKQARELVDKANATPLGKIAKKLEMLVIIFAWWLILWCIRWCGE